MISVSSSHETVHFRFRASRASVRGGPATIRARPCLKHKHKVKDGEEEASSPWLPISLGFVTLVSTSLAAEPLPPAAWPWQDPFASELAEAQCATSYRLLSDRDFMLR